ncbi:MAG: hypothetical protein ACOCRK_01380 [bacterium]
MSYEIKNISNIELDVSINKEKEKILIPGHTTYVDNIQPLKKLLNLKYIKVINCNDNDNDNDNDNNNDNINNTNIVNKTINNKNNIDLFFQDSIKIKLKELLFNFIFNEENTSSSDLQLLKWFYKKVSFTRNISDETIKLIDEANNQEELMEILLNHIYPELIDLFFKNNK